MDVNGGSAGLADSRSAAGFFCAVSQLGRVLLLALAVLLLQEGMTLSQDGADPPQRANDVGLLIDSARTDSPRHTLASLIRLKRELESAAVAYKGAYGPADAERITLIWEELITLVDLSEVPVAARREIGSSTAGYLLDIFGRVDLPDLSTVPDASAFEANGPASYPIPETPLRIDRIEDGQREGEFLFSARTVRAAPRFYRSIERLPLHTSLPIESWSTEIRQITGPMIPASIVEGLPQSAKEPVLDTPIWKIITVVALTTFAAGLLVAWHRTVRFLARRSPNAYRWLRILSPLAIVVVIFVLQGFINYQVNVAGQFSRIVDGAATALVYLAWTWAFWLLAIAIFEWIVLAPQFPEGSLDSSMLRLVARIIGTLGGVAILAIGAQSIGLPVLSLLAGLGIGGLAVALAIRPTLENLIGGFVLFLDKPIRVGDFCTFGNQSGTVESIGVRSTQIRALDRTLIAIPNAQFADMQIVNWARCDQMLIDEVIGLRYETTSDQLRYVLARIREMFHAHPRIDSDTVRVRFARYGDSSLNITIRVYAKTREWNDFYAIKEDILFRIKEIVERAGTGFAFPSQTLYVRKDEGLDAELGEKVKQRVSEWRRAGQLPFPRFPADRLRQLEGRLSYPPRGSPDFNATDEELIETGDERLSAEPRQEDGAAGKPEAKAPAEAERQPQERSPAR